MYKKKFIASDGTEVLFREPKKKDAKDCMLFINKFVNIPFSGILIDKKKTLKEEQKWIENILKGIKKKKGVYIFVEYKGKVKGICNITQKDHKQKHRASTGLSLSKELRGKGIGEALLKESLLLAKKNLKEVDFIELGVLDYNKRAFNLYKKVGFKKVGKIPKSVKEKGKYADEYLMYLYL